MKIILIRHGATKANMEHRYLGRTDECLCMEGMDELRTNKEMGIYPDVDYLFTSPMKRCLETAKIIYPDKEKMVIPDWVEMDFGAFEGKNYIELQEDKRYQQWIDSNATLPFPKGESRQEFITRCKRGLYSMCSEKIIPYTGQENGILQDITSGLIVHGGTIMAILSSFCGGDYFDYQVKNGKGYICDLSFENENIKITNLIKI